jgi:hypothetical protein
MDSLYVLSVEKQTVRTGAMHHMANRNEVEIRAFFARHIRAKRDTPESEVI